MHAWVSSVSLYFLYYCNSGKTAGVFVRVILQGLEHGCPGQEIRSFKNLMWFSCRLYAQLSTLWASGQDEAGVSYRFIL